MDFKIVPSKQAREAIAVGFQNHWRFRIVNENSFKRDWVIETLPEAPQKAQERIQMLKTAGIGIKGFIVAHEAPRLLVAPEAIPTVDHPSKPTMESKDPNVILPIGEILLFILGMFFQLVPILLLDPALIAVLNDGTWLEVMTWYQ